MASKLDEAIAKVAIVIGGRDRAEMDRVASEVALTLTPKDLEKFPDRWYPKFSAKKAGAPELEDSWSHDWFEALTELLYQKKEQGLPGLFVFMERDDSTYHHFAILRLLRLAADGIATTEILARVRARLTTLQHVWTRSTTREVTYFKSTDPRPLELLKQMSDIVVPRMDGDTVGTFLEDIGVELPIHLARMAQQAKEAAEANAK